MLLDILPTNGQRMASDQRMASGRRKPAGAPCSPIRWWLHTVLPALLLAGLVANAAAEPWRRHTIDGSSRGADGVRVADVTGDGLADIATGWEEGGVVRAYVHPGPAKAKEPWPAVTVGQVKSPEDAVFADLDDDGASDVISCCEGRVRSVFVHWSPAPRDRYLDSSAWRTEAIPATRDRQMWMFALPLQIDGQGGVDLVVGAKGDAATIGWLQSPARPRDLASWRFHALYRAGWIMSLEAHDMDGDGDADVLASDRKGARRGVLWLENPGAAAAAAGREWRERRVGGSDREVMFLTLSDMDQDGCREVVCAVSGRGIAVYRRAAAGLDEWQTHEIAMPVDCGTGKGIAVGDIDLDGKQDVIFSCEQAVGSKSGVRWLAYRESMLEPVWQDHEISGPEGVKFDRLELLDLDADGDLDVVTCEERDNLGVIWYENPTR